MARIMPLLKIMEDKGDPRSGGRELFPHKSRIFDPCITDLIYSKTV